MSIVSKSTTRKELNNAEVTQICREKGVQLIQLQFVDIHGTPKQVTVHVDMLPSVLNNEIMLDGSSIAGFRSIERADMYFWPDKSTLKILPWTQGGKTVAFMICDINNPDGSQFEGCPRNNLKRVVEKATKLGYTYNVGPELEFFLFKKDSNGKPTLEPHDDACYYSLAPDDLAEDVRSRIVETLEALDFTIEASHHEVAAGQHEINFQFSDALTTADNATIFKIVVRKIAADFGLHATFMPKPISGINGSGMHSNQSLSDVHGNNIFLDENAEHQLSAKCLNYIAGILKNIPQIAAITNPSVNSYKRLVPGYEAPVYIAWSPSNRSALIRIPAKRGKATRIELRSPDPSCNPYLSFAAMLTAGLDGIQNNLKAPAPVQLNIYQLDESARKEHMIESLPGSLGEAIANLKQSTIAKEALGEHIFSEFVKIKTKEWDEYRNYVSGWEIDRYLSNL